jgi:hypothetical protein
MKNPLLGKFVIGGSSTVDHNTTILREPVLKTTHFEQLSPTFAEFFLSRGHFQQALRVPIPF